MAPDVDRLFNELTCERVFRGKNGLLAALSIHIILSSLFQKFRPYIDSVQLVGSFVNCYLSRDFLVENFKRNELFEQEHLFSEDFMLFLNNPAFDIDIRISLNRSAFHFQEGKLVGLSGLHQSIFWHLCSFISSKTQESSTSKSIADFFFKKKSLDIDLKEQESLTKSFALYSLKTNGKMTIDFAIGLNMDPYLFQCDALGINLLNLIDSAAPRFAPLVTHEGNGWPALLTKLLQEIGIKNPETKNILAFPLSCIKEAKGLTCPGSCPKNPLLLRYLELLKTARPPKKRRPREKTFAYASQKQLPEVIFDQFTLCLKNHLKKDPIGAFFFAFTLRKKLASHFPHPDTLLPRLFDKAIAYIKKINKEEPLEAKIEILMEASSDKSLSFDFIAHTLALQCFFHDMAGMELANGCQIIKKKHAQEICLQLCWKGWHLLLPFDPLQSIKSIADFSRPLNEHAKALLNLFPLKSSKKMASSTLQKLPLDFDELQKNCILLLKKASTYRLGYRLWIASQKRYPANLHTPLDYLPEAIHQEGKELILDLLSIHNIPNDHTEVLQTVHRQLKDGFGQQEILIECIDALVKSHNQDLISKGWNLYNTFMHTPLHDRQGAGKQLLLRAGTYSLAHRFFKKLSLLPKETIFHLQRLLDLAQKEKSFQDIDMALESTYQWISNDQKIPSSPEKSHLWLKCCEIYLTRDPEKSFLLWKQKHNTPSYPLSTAQLKIQYNDFLIALIKQSSSQIREDLLNLLLGKKLEPHLREIIREELVSAVNLGDKSSISKFLEDPNKRCLLAQEELLECNLSYLELKIIPPLPPFKALEPNIKEIYKKTLDSDSAKRLIHLFNVLITAYGPLQMIDLIIDCEALKIKKRLKLLEVVMGDEKIKNPLAHNQLIVLQLLLKILKFISQYSKNENEEILRKQSRLSLALIKGTANFPQKSQELKKISIIVWENHFELLHNEDIHSLLEMLNAHQIPYAPNQKIRSKIIQGLQHDLSSHDLTHQSYRLYQESLAQNRWSVKEMTLEEVSFQEVLISQILLHSSDVEIESSVEKIFNNLGEEPLSIIFDYYQKMDLLNPILKLIKSLRNDKGDKTELITKYTLGLFKKLISQGTKEATEKLLKEQPFFSKRIAHCEWATCIASHIEKFLKTEDPQHLEMGLKLISAYQIQDFDPLKSILLQIQKLELLPQIKAAFEALQKWISQNPLSFQSIDCQSLFLGLLRALQETCLPGELLYKSEKIKSLLEKTSDPKLQLEILRISAIAAFSQAKEPQKIQELFKEVQNILSLISSPEQGDDLYLINNALIQAAWSCQSERFFLLGTEKYLSQNALQEEDLLKQANFAAEQIENQLRQKKSSEYKSEAIANSVLDILRFICSSSPGFEGPPPLKLLNTSLHYSANFTLLSQAFNFLSSWIEQSKVLKKDPKQFQLSGQLFKKFLKALLYLPEGSLSDTGLRLSAAMELVKEAFPLFKCTQPEGPSLFSQIEIEELKGEFLLKSLQNGKFLAPGTKTDFKKSLTKYLPRDSALSTLTEKCVDAYQDMIISVFCTPETRIDYDEHHRHLFQNFPQTGAKIVLCREQMIKKMLALKNVNKSTAIEISYNLVREFYHLLNLTATKFYNSKDLLELFSSFAFSEIHYSYDSHFFVENTYVILRLLALLPIPDDFEAHLIVKLSEISLWLDIQGDFQMPDKIAGLIKNHETSPLAEKSISDLISRLIGTKNTHCQFRILKILEIAKKRNLIKLSVLSSALRLAYINSLENEDLYPHFGPYIGRSQVPSDLLLFFSNVLKSIEPQYERRYIKPLKEKLLPAIYGFPNPPSSSEESAQIDLSKKTFLYEIPPLKKYPSRWILSATKI